MKENKPVEQQIDYNSLSYDELTQISRNDHQEDVHQYDIQQNALCLVMIGGICLICAILFLILSSVREKNMTTGIDPTCLPFFVCIGCSVAAAVLLTIGLVRFFRAHNRRKALKTEIMCVTSLKSAMIKAAK